MKGSWIRNSMAMAVMVFSIFSISMNMAFADSFTINSGALYTNSADVTLNLNVTKTAKVAGYYLSTKQKRPLAADPGWILITPVNSYVADVSYTLPLGDGQKAVYLWYQNVSGNVSKTDSASIILDTTSPALTINLPQGQNASFTTNTTPITLSGSCADATSGIAEIGWANDKGVSGIAMGTSSWSIDNLNLLDGDNLITITAKDNAGNSAVQTLTITYTLFPLPIAAVSPAANITLKSATLNATVDPKDQSAFVYFQYGLSPLNYTDTTQETAINGNNPQAVSIPITGLLTATSYYYRVVSRNSAGTSYGDEGSLVTQSLPSVRASWGFFRKIGQSIPNLMQDKAKLQAAASLYKKYDFNTLFIDFDRLVVDAVDSDGTSDFQLSPDGETFLQVFAQEGIRVILNFHNANIFLAYDATGTRPAVADTCYQRIKTFLLSLDRYRQQDPAAYNNILAYFVGDDIGSARITGCKDFVGYIKNDIYNNQTALNRDLDIPLMADTSRIEKTAKLLKDAVDSVGGYDYPLQGKSSLYGELKDFLLDDVTGSIANINEQSFFTNIQAHSQFWYNAFFYNNADFSLDLPLPPVSDPLPEGVHTASYIYQALMANAKRYIFFNSEYLKEGDTNAQDRLAEIGLANKLVKILWDPVLKGSVLNRANPADGIQSADGRFVGSVLNFKDSSNNDGALLVISNTNANYIVGNTSGTDVTFDLQNINTGLDLTRTDLKVVQIQFPQITAASLFNQVITIPALYDNTLILITADQGIIDTLTQGLAFEESPQNITSAKPSDLVKEAFKGRFAKTQKEITDMRSGNGYFAAAFDQDAVLTQSLQDLINFNQVVDTQTYEEIRPQISRIGDFQLAVYEKVHKVTDAELMGYYPDAEQEYRDIYWQANSASGGSTQPDLFKAKIPYFMDTRRPQKLHFYLLSEYIANPKILYTLKNIGGTLGNSSLSNTYINDSVFGWHTISANDMANYNNTNNAPLLLSYTLQGQYTPSELATALDGLKQTIIAEMGVYNGKISGVVLDWQPQIANADRAVRLTVENSFKEIYTNANTLGLLFGLRIQPSVADNYNLSGLDLNKADSFCHFIMPMMYAQSYGMNRAVLDGFLDEQRKAANVPIIALLTLATSGPNHIQKISPQEISSLYKGFAVDGFAVDTLQYADDNYILSLNGLLQ